MTSTIRPRAAAFREAVAHLSASLQTDALQVYETNFACRDGLLSSASPTRDHVAWALVGMWAVAAGRGAPPSSFAEVERAFYGKTYGLQSITDHVALNGQTQAIAALEKIEPGDLEDLIPYLLDRSDLGTRRQVLRDPSQVETRKLRKSSGTFYTPADVADYIVREIATISDGRYVDPACGTGVFLLAIIRQLLSLGADPLDALSAMYGIDVDSIALDSASFGITAYLSSTALRDFDPIRIWHLARLNLARRDSLALLAEAAENSDRPISASVSERQALRGELIHGRVLPRILERATRGTLDSIFPEAVGGFDGVVANPPYAPLGPRPDLLHLVHGLESLQHGAGTRRTNTFVAFMEYMWKASTPVGSAGMIVPMSVAYSGVQSVRQLRAAISRVSADWTFRFYDRTPDSIFGDDVKQRVCIVTMRKRPGRRASTFTSGLLRWTSSQRPDLFANQPSLVDISSLAIVNGIPKLSHQWELDLFRALTVVEPVAGDTEWRLGTRPGNSEDRLWVGATAYNWLAVYRRLDASTPAVDSNVVLAPSESAADWAYAVLRSRVVYWLWRVLGDGFHVPQAFLAQLPFVWRSSDVYDSRLSQVGRELWAYARARPNQSVNAGRVTVSFLQSQPDLLNEADSLVLARYPVARDTADHLRVFLSQNLLVGRSRSRGIGILVEED